MSWKECVGFGLGINQLYFLMIKYLSARKSTLDYVDTIFDTVMLDLRGKTLMLYGHQNIDFMLKSDMVLESLP